MPVHLHDTLLLPQRCEVSEHKTDLPHVRLVNLAHGPATKALHSVHHRLDLVAARHILVDLMGTGEEWKHVTQCTRNCKGHACKRPAATARPLRLLSATRNSTF